MDWRGAQRGRDPNAISEWVDLLEITEQFLGAANLPRAERVRLKRGSLLAAE